LPVKVTGLLEAHSPGAPIWPERFDKGALATLLQELGPRVFSAQYLNAPSDPEVVDFREEHLRYFEFNAKGDLRVLPRRGVEMEIVPRSSLSVCGAWDPALEAKTTACRSAVTVVGVDPKDRVFLLEVYARRREPLEMLDDVLRLAQKWQPDLGFAIEDVAFQRVLIDLIRRRAPRYGFSTSLFRGVKPLRGKDKESRIRALIGAAFAEGRVYIQAVQTDFIEEYIQFPIGKTVDILDAFAYSALLWRRGETDVQAEERVENERARLELRHPITGY
jgi:predicted phage terminase large subunit-like protein